MFFQGRGNVTLYPLDSDLEIDGPPIQFCTDSFGITPQVESFSHVNKCGAVDVEDARGIKSQSVAVQMTCADVADKKFAVGVFGTVNVAGSPLTVTNENVPVGMVAGDIWFAGGKTRHRALTAVVITDSASTPATLTLTTDYTVDAASGAITFTTAGISGRTQPFQVDYGYTDPASVSLMTAGQREYMLNYEFLNRQAANDPGSLELYRTRFDPAANLDFQSDELQVMDLKGSCLADTSRSTTDTVLGQFGRRIL